MFKYSNSVTNDEDFVEEFEITTPGTDITNWNIEFKVGSQNATVTKDIPAQSFTVKIPLATMQGFCPGSYGVGCRYTLDGITSQILVGSLSVIEGNFTP